MSPLARYLVWAKVTLIVFGVVLVFVEIPSGTLIYPIAGLVVFAGLTLFDSALRRAVCTVVWAAFAN